MPKRPPTPEMNTGTHLVTIWNPWPADIRVDPKEGLHKEDCKKLVRWISCIVGTDNVLALYYKPRSKDTIIVEVSDFNQYKGRMLGEHHWIDVFRNLKDHQKGQTSKLYLCPLGDYLKLEKQRWRETKIEAEWFDGWNPTRNNMVNIPYPKSTWCDLPNHHGIDEFCGKIPVSLFPGEAAAREKAKAPTMSQQELSAKTTPGALQWTPTGGPKPSMRPVPALDPASASRPKQPIVRNYRKVEAVTTEQSMRAVLGPPTLATHLATDENGEPSLVPEGFDWFEDVEEDDDVNNWAHAEPPDWEFSNLSVQSKPFPIASPEPANKEWQKVGPSWDGDEDDEPSTLAPSMTAGSTLSSMSPPPTPSTTSGKPQVWAQPARNAWGPKTPVNSAKPSPTPPSSRGSGSDWSTAGKGKGKATQRTTGGAGRGRAGAGRGQQKARP